MTDLSKIAGNNIKEWRKTKGLSQGELASITDIAQARLSRIESGGTDIGIKTLQQIAEGLKVTPGTLLIDGENPNTSLSDKLERIESLSEYDQKLVEALLESLFEKSRLIQMQESKMKSRLEELERVRGKK